MTRKELEAKVLRLEDKIAIQDLQSRYNYYLAMYWGEKIVDELFAKKDPDVIVNNNGAEFLGLEGVRRNFVQLDKVHRNEPGRMGAIMGLQPLINVAKDGKTARGCWYIFGPCVLPTERAPKEKECLEAMWMFGRYDNDYVKEDGMWKIKKLRAFLHFLSPVRQGWFDCPLPRSVRTFDTEEGVKPDTEWTYPYLYKPEGPNTYGPPLPNQYD